MTKYVFLTQQDQTLRHDLNDMDGTELIGAGSDFFTWSWTNPNETDLDAVKANTSYVGDVLIAS